MDPCSHVVVEDPLPGAALEIGDRSRGADRSRFDRHGGRATLLKVVVAAATYDERVVEILTDKFGPIEQFLAAEALDRLAIEIVRAPGFAHEAPLLSGKT